MSKIKLEQHVFHSTADDPSYTFDVPDGAEILSVEAQAGPETTYIVVTKTLVRDDGAGAPSSEHDHTAPAPGSPNDSPVVTEVPALQQGDPEAHPPVLPVNPSVGPTPAPLGSDFGMVPTPDEHKDGSPDAVPTGGPDHPLAETRPDLAEITPQGGDPTPAPVNAADEDEAKEEADESAEDAKPVDPAPVDPAPADQPAPVVTDVTPVDQSTSTDPAPVAPASDPASAVPPEAGSSV